MWEVPEGIEAPVLVAALAAQPANRKRADDAFEEGLTRLLGSVAAEFGVWRVSRPWSSDDLPGRARASRG